MTIFVVDIEPVETRYTGQWKTYVPKYLRDNTNHNVMVVDGVDDIPAATTPGAFLNFGGTNVYKAKQVERIGRMFCDGYIQDGDHFVFTDAWHPGIINVKYMAELLGVKVKTHGLWHAGSYDPQDFLGRLIGDADWVRHAEKSFYYAFDHNYFATNFHIEMFCEGHFGLDSGFKKDQGLLNNKIVRCGWPMNYMRETMSRFRTENKKDRIIFPHRIAPEKQVEIFRDLAETLPQYEWVVCRDKELTKDEYHTLFAESKMNFSCSLQETLGITQYEGALLGVLPVVPDRLSYSEMYDPNFKYPSDWTINWDSYLKYKEYLVPWIKNLMDNYDGFTTTVDQQAFQLTDEFFTATNLIKKLQ